MKNHLLTPDEEAAWQRNETNLRNKTHPAAIARSKSVAVSTNLLFLCIKADACVLCLGDSRKEAKPVCCDHGCVGERFEMSHSSKSVAASGSSCLTGVLLNR